MSRDTRNLYAEKQALDKIEKLGLSLRDLSAISEHGNKMFSRAKLTRLLGENPTQKLTWPERDELFELLSALEEV